MTDQQPELVTLTNVDNEAEAKSLIGLFEDEGITVFINGAVSYTHLTLPTIYSV